MIKAEYNEKKESGEDFSLLRKRSLRSSFDMRDSTDFFTRGHKEIKIEEKLKFPSINEVTPAKKTGDAKTILDIIEDRRTRPTEPDSDETNPTRNSKNNSVQKRSSAKKTLEEMTTEATSITLTSEKESLYCRNGLAGADKKSKAKKKKISSNSFKSRNYAKKWTEKETKLFYRCLTIFGTDFSMIALMSKGRTRNQIINKFHKEEKEDADKVEDALKAHRKCDAKIIKKYMKYFEQMSNQPKPISSRKVSNASQNCGDFAMFRKTSTGSMNSLDSVDMVNYFFC